jgi:hypothetical protein
MFVALGLQHEMRMGCIFICVLQRSWTSFFDVIPQNDQVLEKKFIEYKNFVLIFSILLYFLKLLFFILGRTERDIIKNVRWFSCKVSVILVRV